MSVLNELNEMFDEAIENSDKRTLGQILQEKRLAQKLKLADIAKVTELSESIVGRIEADQVKDMKISTMKKLSLAYGVSYKIFVDHLGDDISEVGIQENIRQISEARLTLGKR